MPHQTWSPEALANIQRLYRFPADKSTEAARRAAGAIRDGMEIVAGHPNVGRPVDNMDSGYMEWPISFDANGYVVLYHVQHNRALVVAVRHQKETDYQPF